MKAIVIVDFDNFFPGKISDYKDSIFENIFNSVINNLIPIDNVTDIHFRLYGGWYKGDVLTNKCSEVAMKLSSFNNLFPKFYAKRKIEGDFEIAMQQNDIPYIWKNTYREHLGIPKLRIDDSKLSDKCGGNKPSCPIHIMKSFTKSTSRTCVVPGCNTKHEEVFFRREQKMVDTMMACDVISYTLSEEKTIIAIVSDDVDLFPSIALRHKIDSSSELSLFIKNNQNETLYSQILNQFNVKVNLTHYE